MWNITGDRTMLALAMTFSDKPMAMNMSFQREYADTLDEETSSSSHSLQITSISTRCFQSVSDRSI